MSHSTPLRITLIGLLSIVAAAACDTPPGHRGHDEHDAATSSLDAGPAGALPRRALWIAGGGSGRVIVVDAESLTVAREIPLEASLRPHHFFVDYARGRVLVSALSSDLSGGHGGGHGAHGGGARSAIYAIDMQTGDAQKVLEISATAHNAALTADGRGLVLAMAEHGMVQVYDAETFAEAWAVTGLATPLEVTPTREGSLLVAESGAARVAQIDLDARALVGSVDVGALPVAAWSASDESFYVALEEGARVRRLDPSSLLTIAQTYETRGMVGQVAVRRSEVWAAVEDRGVVAIFDRGTAAALTEIAAGVKPHGIAVDGDQRVFVTDEAGGRLLAIDAEARVVTQELAVGDGPNGIVLIERD